MLGQRPHQSLILPHPAEDLIAESSPQGPDGLGLRVACGLPLLEILPALARTLQPGHGDAMAGDGAGIDVWVGSEPGVPGSAPRVGAILCTVDLLKRDTEIKLLIGCTPDDQRAILAFTTGDSMRAIVVQRPV